MIYNDFSVKYAQAISDLENVSEGDFDHLEHLSNELYKHVESVFFTHSEEFGKRHLINTLTTLVNGRRYKAIERYLESYTSGNGLIDSTKYLDAHYMCVTMIKNSMQTTIDDLFDLQYKYFLSSLTEQEFRDRVKKFTYRYCSIHIRVINYELSLSLPNEAKVATSIPDQRDNQINDMPYEEIKDWFMVFTRMFTKEGNAFLNEEEVVEFIARAFYGKPFDIKQTINGSKGKVKGKFHDYFTRCQQHMPGVGRIDKNINADKYLKLLTNHFEGYDYELEKQNFRAYIGSK